MPVDSTLMRKILYIAIPLILLGCTPVHETALPPTKTPTKVVTQSSTALPTHTAAFIETPSATPDTPTPTKHVFEICVPLEVETFNSLKLILSKPLDIPVFGADTGHHGVDFAYFQRDDRESIQGIEIYAILPGKAVTTLEDNIPYGYTLLIETPLSNLPQSLQNTLMDGYLPVPDDPNYRLYCPDVKPPVLTENLSVYHLYAHMEIKPEFEPGDQIRCGQKLGTVGSTGYSSNPHLHLETRLGPSGAEISDMAHYESSYTLDQLSTYCLWRMSGYFQLFDPFILFEADELITAP
jgi:murein DD-endopeptidase MepM/ murein hydrolase activator NlpD